MQRKLVFKEGEMLNELLNKENMKKAIVRKGNLSASGLDKLTFPILKYEKDDAADLMVSIMNMMLRLQKYPEFWKDEKVVMLPKPCDERGKDKPENWRLLTLTDVFY
jgi:hypothetical protein